MQLYGMSGVPSLTAGLRGPRRLEGLDLIELAVIDMQDSLIRPVHDVAERLVPADGSSRILGARQQNLAAALVTFAQGTSASIIAEGIETEGEFKPLRNLCIPYGQGYYLGRPGLLA